MKVGDVVADFEAIDQEGATVRMTELLQRGPLVLYFYVRAMTPG